MTDPRRELYRMIGGALDTQLVHVAAELGIADLLADGPRAADDLAAACEADPRSLSRLLRALAAAGILRHTDDDRFETTEMGRWLRTDIAQSLRNEARMAGSEHYAALGALLHAVRTGEPAFEHVYGRPVFDYLGDHPTFSAIFNDAMREWTTHVAPQVVAAYDFNDIRTLVDIGGGTGVLLAHIVASHKRMRGVLFDLPQGLVGAEEVLDHYRVADRIDRVAGDFFGSIPRADAVIMKSILHDWSDDDAVRILHACADAVGSDGRVLMVEHVLPQRITPDRGRASFVDVVMMAMLRGRERTRAEFESLLDAAGLTLQRIIGPLDAGPSILEATR